MTRVRSRYVFFTLGREARPVAAHERQRSKSVGPDLVELDSARRGLDTQYMRLKTIDTHQNHAQGAWFDVRNTQSNEASPDMHQNPRSDLT